MSNKQQLQKAVKAYKKALEQERKDISKAAEEINQVRQEQTAQPYRSA